MSLSLPVKVLREWAVGGGADYLFHCLNEKISIIARFGRQRVKKFAQESKLDENSQAD